MKPIPTKLYQETLDALLRLPGGLALEVYLVLCALGGHRPDGWSGSVRGIQRELEARSGRSRNRRRIKGAVAALVTAGLLDIDDRSYRLTVAKNTRGQNVPVSKSIRVQNVTTPRGQNVSKTGQNVPPNDQKRRKIEETTDELTKPCSTFKTIDDLGTAPSAAPSSSSISRIELLELIDNHPIIRGRLKGAPLDAIVERCGTDEVARQLAWFKHRDTSWAQNGPVAALVSYCRAQEPEPGVLVAQRKRVEETKPTPTPTDKATADETRSWLAKWSEQRHGVAPQEGQQPNER